MLESPSKLIKIALSAHTGNKPELQEEGAVIGCSFKVPWEILMCNQGQESLTLP